MTHSTSAKAFSGAEGLLVGDGDFGFPVDAEFDAELDVRAVVLGFELDFGQGVAQAGFSLFAVGVGVELQDCLAGQAVGAGFDDDDAAVAFKVRD